jgi:hypothetical protein
MILEIRRAPCLLDLPELHPLAPYHRANSLRTRESFALRAARLSDAVGLTGYRLLIPNFALQQLNPAGCSGCEGDVFFFSC